MCGGLEVGVGGLFLGSAQPGRHRVGACRCVDRPGIHETQTGLDRAGPHAGIPSPGAGYVHEPEYLDQRFPRAVPHGSRFYASSVLRCSNGSTTATPAFSKSARFRVAMASPCTRAVAAIRLSLSGIARPDARRPAIDSAQRRPVAASHGKQCSRPIPSANQRSSRARRRPRDLPVA